MFGDDFVALSLPPILTGIFAAIACALPGNFLILRRQALIGDAISHVVLPGIVVAFLFTGAISTWPMMLGAGGAAIFAVGLIEAIKRFGSIEPGAAMGVAFTSMFAAGVLILELSDTSSVHLDVEHALYGNLESLIWLDGENWNSVFDISALATLPDELIRICVTSIIVCILTFVFWRPLKISTFDPVFAAAIGIPVNIIGFGLVVVAAMAAVAAFDAVGSIIVIAMFICPSGAARLMTNRLETQVLWSIIFATASAIIGYCVAGYGPLWFGFDNSVSAAGMIATISGLILALACLFAPHRKTLTPNHQ